MLKQKSQENEHRPYSKHPRKPLSCFCLKDSGVAIVPRGSLRFAVQGAGVQFVHGGASLQEVCVPVITYHHQRAKGDEGPARKVRVQVSARVRRVTNNRFSLTLVQTEAVEGRWRSR